MLQERVQNDIKTAQPSDPGRNGPYCAVRISIPAAVPHYYERFFHIRDGQLGDAFLSQDEQNVKSEGTFAENVAGPIV